MDKLCSEIAELLQVPGTASFAAQGNPGQASLCSGKQRAQRVLASMQPPVGCGTCTAPIALV